VTEFGSINLQPCACLMGSDRLRTKTRLVQGTPTSWLKWLKGTDIAANDWGTHADISRFKRGALKDRKVQESG
jgi:hypothetical protein